MLNQTAAASPAKSSSYLSTTSVPRSSLYPPTIPHLLLSSCPLPHAAPVAEFHRPAVVVVCPKALRTSDRSIKSFASSLLLCCLFQTSHDHGPVHLFGPDHLLRRRDERADRSRLFERRRQDIFRVWSVYTSPRTCLRIYSGSASRGRSPSSSCSSGRAATEPGGVQTVVTQAHFVRRVCEFDGGSPNSRRISPSSNVVKCFAILNPVPAFPSSFSSDNLVWFLCRARPQCPRPSLPCGDWWWCKVASSTRNFMARKRGTPTHVQYSAYSGLSCGSWDMPSRSARLASHSRLTSARGPLVEKTLSKPFSVARRKCRSSFSLAERAKFSLLRRRESARTYHRARNVTVLEYARNTTP